MCIGCCIQRGGTEARNIYSKYAFVHAMMPLQMHLRTTLALAPDADDRLVSRHGQLTFGERVHVAR